MGCSMSIYEFQYDGITTHICYGSLSKIVTYKVLFQFSAIDDSIKKWLMKMHLTNLLNKHKSSENEKEQAYVYFKDKLVSSSSVEDFIKTIR